MSYGKLIVCNDEWPTSDTGYAEVSDTRTFVTNVLNWFTSKPSSNFLVPRTGESFLAHNSRHRYRMQATGSLSRKAT